MSTSFVLSFPSFLEELLSNSVFFKKNGEKDSALGSRFRKVCKHFAQTNFRGKTKPFVLFLYTKHYKRKTHLAELITVD